MIFFYPISPPSVKPHVLGHPSIGQDGDRFIVGDPMRGPETLSRDQLQQRYEFTGFHMRFKNNRDAVRIAD